MKMSTLGVALIFSGMTAVTQADMDPKALVTESLGKLAAASAMSVDIAIAEEAVLSQGTEDSHVARGLSAFESSRRIPV